MPDRFRGGAFEPDFAATLVDVFETVCRQLKAERGAAPSVDLRDRIVNAIVHQAERGVTDVLILEQAGLNTVLGDVE